MKYLLTCSAWLEAIAKKEITKQNWTITEVKDRLVFFTWEIDLTAKINLNSRVWNKLYIVLWELENTANFDNLYDMSYDINWKKYITDTFPIIVKATSIKSDLTSTPAIQKIVKKSIVDKLNWKSGKIILEDLNKPKFEILTMIIENKSYILLNTSGETLYKRWYKTDAWEAPIKENLARALVILANWKYSESFYDITCWSWTIAIEARLIAKNIAPWIYRNFAFENRSFVSKDILKNEKILANQKIYTKKFAIFASDIDPEILEIAKHNAKNAWVYDDIIFERKDLKLYKQEKLQWTIVSNPPYWLRLKVDDLRAMYKDLYMILDKNPELNWWFITSYADFDNIINTKKIKKRKLYNWNELCYFYQKNI